MPTALENCVLGKKIVSPKAYDYTTGTWFFMGTPHNSNTGADFEQSYFAKLIVKIIIRVVQFFRLILFLAQHS